MLGELGPRGPGRLAQQHDGVPLALHHDRLATVAEPGVPGLVLVLGQQNGDERVQPAPADPTGRVRIAASYQPDPVARAVYDRRYRTFLALYRKNRRLYAGLDRPAGG